jgi:hypothetical protein
MAEKGQEPDPVPIPKRPFPSEESEPVSRDVKNIVVIAIF